MARNWQMPYAGRNRSRGGVWLIFRRLIVACEIRVGRKMCLTPWFSVRDGAEGCERLLLAVTCATA